MASRVRAPRAGVALVRESDLARELGQVGVRRSGVLLVHASMKRLGYVMHGAEAVFSALRGLLGPEGTLLVPTFTGARTDPACWTAPALPRSVWEETREATPLFDPVHSLPEGMGGLATRVLFDPASRRSNHPLCSFAALGPHAEELLSEHDLLDPFGPKSPLAAARRLRAQVLLLGVDQRSNAALLHAQVLADAPAVRRRKGTFLAEVDGERTWVRPERLPECSEGFGRIEDDLVSRGLVRVARVGDGTCRLMRMHPVVAHVEHCLRLRPEWVHCGRDACRQCN